MFWVWSSWSVGLGSGGICSILDCTSVVTAASSGRTRYASSGMGRPGIKW